MQLVHSINSFADHAGTRFVENLADSALERHFVGASLRYSTAFLHRYFFIFTLSNNLFRSSG